MAPQPDPDGREDELKGGVVPEKFGLTFQNESEWQAWANGHRRLEGALRKAKSRLRPPAPERGTLYLPDGEIRTLLVIDKLTPSCRYAIGDPVQHFSSHHTAVLAPVGMDIPFPERFIRQEPFAGVDSLPQSIRAVLSLGSYIGFSAAVSRWARQNDVEFFVVQHGLMTPWAPPAPRGAHVLAWNDADAEFWSAGRSDLRTTVVGSQMLWDAGNADPIEAINDRPIVLGQLHGAELSRKLTFSAYWDFCRRVESDYRPHPNESDVVSKALHKVMERGGISFERSGMPLTTLARPVVSIFSTGTLEVAQRGLPAWVTHPDPEPWVRNFWERYGLAEWGQEPTKPWAQPALEPAQAVARAVEDA